MERHRRRLPPSLLSSVITPPFISSFPSEHNYCHSMVDFFGSRDVATETAPARPDSRPSRRPGASPPDAENIAQTFLPAQIEGAFTHLASHLCEVRPR